MKGTILDFLRLAAENPDLGQDLAALATKHGFEFDADELDQADLDAVAGGMTVRREGQLTSTSFENANQKSTQYLNMLASVLKTTQETKTGIIRNIR